MRSKGRTHIVLIPGFAGFDALGQMQYYAGVTGQYRQWCGATGEDASSGNANSGTNNQTEVELHYFDNFPTASVETRSKRLLQYLAKRMARGTFNTGDKISLVGHSTGGLDIRRLIWDLGERHERNEDIFVDGCQIKAAAVLELIDRIVFISVPQFGTNLANRIQGNFFLREAIISELRTVLAASQMPVVDRIQHFFSNCTSAALNLDIGLAVQDALNESAAGGSRDAMGTALAQEAASELALWLRHMAWDFSVVDDLAITSKDLAGKSISKRSERLLSSPAHFTPEMRQAEQATWKKFAITPLSLVTVAKGPKDRSRKIVTDTYAEFTEFSMGAATGTTIDTSTDITFDWCYGATAQSVPSKILQSQAAPKFLWTAGSSTERKIEAGDNDGIVNTASMLWPSNQANFLVECDHMDIVGHYKRVPVTNTEGGDADDSRKFIAYDLLKSGSGFDDQAFRLVWSTVFDFCSGVHSTVTAGTHEAGR